MKRFKPLIVLGALSFASVMLAFGGDTAPAPASDKQDQAIVKMAQSFVDAFGKGDANACANFWTADGDYMNAEGHLIKGRKSIAADFAATFAQSKGMTLRIEVSSLRFPTPDTAIEDGVTTVSHPDAPLPSRAHYTNFLVKQDGKWLLSSVRESAYEPPNNYDSLQPLEWAIGEWIEDTKNTHVGRIAFEWSPDKNFILGARAVGVKGVLLDNGTQRIGWDPASKMIRSWTFESDGGFGEASWKASGDKKWAITSSSVLRSGSLIVSTTNITRVDDNTISWQTTNIKVDGKAVPDSAVVTMKRAQ